MQLSGVQRSERKDTKGINMGEYLTKLNKHSVCFISEETEMLNWNSQNQVHLLERDILAKEFLAL